MDEKINRLVQYYIRICGTNDPFIIAHHLGIEIFWVPLGNISGYYKYVKHHRCIYLNANIEDESYLKIVMAHELGHAVLHWKENYCFIKNRTLLSITKPEINANKFAAYLLITEDMIADAKEKNMTTEQFSHVNKMNGQLIELRLKKRYYK